MPDQILILQNSVVCCLLSGLQTHVNLGRDGMI